jgi:hypothetical protein
MKFKNLYPQENLNAGEQFSTLAMRSGDSKSSSKSSEFSEDISESSEDLSDYKETLEERHQVTWLVSENILRFPIVSDFLIWLGCQPYNQKNLQHLMFLGKNIALLLTNESIPIELDGNLGYESQDFMQENQDISYINTSKFRRIIKYGIKYGYTLSFVHTCGEYRDQHLINPVIKSLFWKLSIPIDTALSPFPHTSRKCTTIISEGIKLMPSNTIDNNLVEFYNNKLKQEINTIVSKAKLGNRVILY